MDDTTAPCEPWDVVWCCPMEAVSPTVSGAAINGATDLLWALSGRRLGLCTVTVRPCRSTCPDSMVDRYTTYWTHGWPNPALIDGDWVNLGCGRCTGACGCSEVSEVVFQDYVHDIVSIQVDGVPLATGGGDYRLDNHRRLIRLDGEEWPLCQDWNVADGEVGSWSVTMRVGVPVPDSGVLAVSELATEIMLAMCGNRTCRLPQRVRTVTRGGVTIDMMDAMDFLREGRTGLYLVDAFLNAVNPARLAQRSRVFSPDNMPQGRIVE